MTRETKITWLEWLTRLLLAVAFAYAGGSKVLEPLEFQQAIDRYQLLPYPATAALALYLPWLEVFIALALLLPRRFLARGAALLSFLLMLVFTAAYVSTLARGLNIECGCFGKLTESWSAWQVLARDALLLAGSGYLLWRLRPAIETARE